MSRNSVLESLKNRAPVVAPSMLKCDFGNLRREIELLEAAGAQVLHLDIMDGHFVPNLSYGPMVIERIRDLTELPFDAHLMISEPERYLQDYLKAGCDGITFHFEAVPEPRELLQQIRGSGASAGLAINPGTPVDCIKDYVSDCDLILVMSVEPGFGGQAFQPAALEKLGQLRELRNPSTILSIDGGIGPDTIGLAAEAGADLFVVGSAIFEAADYRAAMTDLTDRARNRCPSSSPVQD